MMSDMFKTMSSLLALCLFSLLIQNISLLRRVDMAFVQYYHDHMLNSTLETISTVIITTLPNIFLIVFLVHNVSIKPNHLENINYLAFLAFACFFNSLLSICFSGFSPQLILLVTKDLFFKEVCFTVYENPSREVFLFCCIYQLVRVRYFRKCVVGLSLGTSLYKGVDTIDFTKQTPIEEKLEDKDIIFLAFRLLSLTYLLVFGFFSIAMGYIFVHQLISGVLFGFFFVNFYFKNINISFKIWIKKAINNKTTKEERLQSIYLICFAVLVFILSVMFVKIEVIETNPFWKVYNILEEKCGKRLYLDLKQLQLSFLFSLPFFFMIFSEKADIKSKFKFSTGITFSDLNKSRKLLRVILTLLPFLVTLAVYYIYEEITNRIENKVLFVLLSLLKFTLLSLTLSVMFIIVHPLLLYKLEINLKEEFDFIDFAFSEDNSNFSDELEEVKKNYKKLNTLESLTQEMDSNGRPTRRFRTGLNEPMEFLITKQENKRNTNFRYSIH